MICGLLTFTLSNNSIRMRPATMAAFSSANFPYETEDKGFKYSTQVMEEPFSDFFDHELTHAISALGGNGNETNDFDLPELFTDGETTSSASYFTDSTSSACSQPTYNTSQDRNREESSSSLTRSAFLPQNYGSRARREKLQPAISGLELLLDIEGQAGSRHHALDSPHSAPPQITTLPLRRKPRFRTAKSTSLQGRGQKLTKASVQPVKAEPKMISPLYIKRHETPQPHEWAHSLEQLSLQSAVDDFPVSPRTNHESQHHSGLGTPRHLTLRDQFLHGESSSGQKGAYTPSTVHLGLDATFGTADSDSQQDTRGEQHDAYNPFGGQGAVVDFESAMVQPQIHHSVSWTTSMDAPNDATYVVPTSQAENTWNHGLPEPANTYYTNGIASKSAPTLPYHASATASTEDLGPTSDMLSIFHTEDLSNDYLVGSAESIAYSLISPQYPPPPMLEPSSTQEQSKAPPRRASSPSEQPSPSRSRRRSKSAHRRKSSGNLKLSKSPVTMGFVNFTPSDSKRILTGVAPSGSSKTKARRELEANEKKRKLSLAVLRAVEEAGGDPEPLRKEGLLIDR